MNALRSCASRIAICGLLGVESHTDGQAHLRLADCAQRAHKLKDALRHSKVALDRAIDDEDVPLMNAARVQVMEIVEQIPRVKFALPADNVTELVVTFFPNTEDVAGTAVPRESLGKTFVVDPGPHRVIAKGKVQGIPWTFDRIIEVKEFETVTVALTLVPDSPRRQTRAITTSSSP
jgi:hypothetical protein